MRANGALPFIFLLLFVSSVANAATYRNQVIARARHVSRPSTNRILKTLGIHHHGVKVTTNQGHVYLLHNTPEKGTVVTEAVLSNKWRTVKELEVQQDKTVGGALKSGSGVTSVGWLNYLTGGTCIGTSCKIKNYLTSRDRLNSRRGRK